MKKKILVAMFIITASVSVGCASQSTQVAAVEDAQPLPTLEIVNKWTQNSDKIIEYRDTETGVHYYYFCESSLTTNGKGIGSAITPRYNADGTLYVD